MKKAIIKSFMVAFILIGLANYFIYLQTGQLPFKKFKESLPEVSMPKLSMPKLSMPSMEELNPAGIIEKISAGEGAELLPSNQTKIHKWVDDKGVVHYSETPPDNTQTEQMLIDADTNLVKGLAPEEYTVAEENSTGRRSVLLGASSEENPAGVNPDSPPVEQAMQAKKMLEDRQNEQKKILDSL